MNKSKWTTVSVLAVVAAATVGCAIEAGPGQQGVKVSSWGDPTINSCLEEETQEYTLDNKYLYPSRSISWDANYDDGAERGPYVALSNSKDQAAMNIPITIVADLTTNCDKLKDFHRNYGTKYEGWLKDDGTPSEGWKQLLNYVISQPAEQAVIGITSKYPWQDVWNNETVRSEYKNALQSQLLQETAARTGGVEYFSNFQVTVGKPDPVNDQLEANVEAKQASIAAAEAKRIEVTSDAKAREDGAKANEAAANAERAATEAEARKRAAEIAGFGAGPEGVDAWLKQLCIEKAPACTPWPQPVFNN